MKVLIQLGDSLFSTNNTQLIVPGALNALGAAFRIIAGQFINLSNSESTFSCIAFTVRIFPVYNLASQHTVYLIWMCAAPR